MGPSRIPFRSGKGFQEAFLHYLEGILRCGPNRTEFLGARVVYATLLGTGRQSAQLALN